ncbi:hypothetical protein [Nocardia huaxiensis]|nr:hypothetical protein [Nocardia huaxiensis]
MSRTPVRDSNSGARRHSASIAVDQFDFQTTHHRFPQFRFLSQ